MPSIAAGLNGAIRGLFRSSSTPTTQDATIGARAHIPGLDGLRGFAILLVMIAHFVTGGTDNTAPGLDRWFSRFAGCGWCGVDLFFVLSGFLITGILYDTRKSGTYLRDFYARRALRIFPLYYGVLVAIFVVLPRISPVEVPGLRDVSQHQVWLWTYSTNFGTILKGAGCFNSGFIFTYHFWSLAAEEQFYLVWPLVVLLLRRETLTRLCILGVCLGFVSRCGLALSGYDGLYRSMPCRLDGLLAGAFVALNVRSGRGVSSLVPAARWVGLSCGTVLAVILATVGLEELHWVTKTAGYTLLAAFFGATLVLVLAAPASSPWAKMFGGRVIRFFGKYSYGLYVWHYVLRPVFNALFSVDVLVDHVFGQYLPARLAYMAMSCAISVAVAWLSWRLYEKHFLRLKRFFEPRHGRTVGDGGIRATSASATVLAAGLCGATQS